MSNVKTRKCVFFVVVKYRENVYKMFWEKKRLNFHISFIFVNLDYMSLMKNLFRLTVGESKNPKSIPL